MFIFLEAIYIFSIIGWVVPKDGLLTRAQNVAVGWGMAFVVVLFCMCFKYEVYGGVYHCWWDLEELFM